MNRPTTTCACGARCYDRGNSHADLCEDCAHRIAEGQEERIAAMEGALRELHEALADLASCLLGRLDQCAHESGYCECGERAALERAHAVLGKAVGK